jgi:hypothetical protein
MKGILIALVLPLTLAACYPQENYCHHDGHGDYHCHDDHRLEFHDHGGTTVYVSGGTSSEVTQYYIVEEEKLCSEYDPYYYAPDYCDYGQEYCCTWTDIGSYETYCWNEWCGWELVISESFL